MNKKRDIIFLGILSVVSVVGITRAVSQTINGFCVSRAIETENAIIFNSRKNVISKSSAVKSERNTTFTVLSSGVISTSNKWQTVEANGYFYTTSDNTADKNAIHEMKTITFNFDTADLPFTICFSYDGSFESDKYWSKSYVTKTGGQTIQFEGHPHYFKFVAGSSAITIDSMKIEYGCNASVDDSWDNAHGVNPIISGNTLTYGLYPQTHVNDSALIDELSKIASSIDEEYIWYNDEYYVKDTGNPYESGLKFNDGTQVVNGTTYFFKCEPIRWNILSSSSGTYSLDCSNIINAHCYGENYSGKRNKTDYQGNTAEAYANNYQFSDIRNWLNVNFYYQTFLNNSYIQNTNVDNSAATTSSPANVYACDNTTEKIYLRSYQDWKSQAGLSIAKKVSDFALCNYAYMSTWYEENRNGYYLTRSPAHSCAYEIRMVNSSGNLGTGEANYSEVGVSPSLTIKID